MTLLLRLCFFNYPNSLCVFLCARQALWVYSRNTLFCLPTDLSLPCFCFSTRVLVFLHPPSPPAFAVCEKHMSAVCACLLCMQSVRISHRLHVWLCICVLWERALLVPPVRVVTSAFISLVWGSRSPLRSAPSQQHGRCHQTHTNTQAYAHTVFTHIKTNKDTFVGHTHKPDQPKQVFFVSPHSVWRLTPK